MTTTITDCRFCGLSHGLKCPVVKAIEYFDDGITVKRVEFMTAADYHPMATGVANPPLRPAFGLATTWGGGAMLTS